MYTLEQAVGEIKNWAEERGLVNPDFKNKQLIKLLEEVGETAGAILKKNESKTVDGVGDIFGLYLREEVFHHSDLVDGGLVRDDNRIILHRRDEGL